MKISRMSNSQFAHWGSCIAQQNGRGPTTTQTGMSLFCPKMLFQIRRRHIRRMLEAVDDGYFGCASIGEACIDCIRYIPNSEILTRKIVLDREIDAMLRINMLALFYAGDWHRYEQMSRDYERGLAICLMASPTLRIAVCHQTRCCRPPNTRSDRPRFPRRLLVPRFSLARRLNRQVRPAQTGPSTMFRQRLNDESHSSLR